jgi:hypothetical protein
MNVAFDLDGTLDHTELVHLCNRLYDSGAMIHIITVAVLAESGYRCSRERKEAKLLKLGVKYHHLHLVEAHDHQQAGEGKAALCEYHKIEVMIDDQLAFVNEMVKGTTAIILHVRMAGEPGGNG